MMISFRLSRTSDADLIGKINDIPKQLRSTMYRRALRSFFFETKNEAVSSAPIIKIDLDENDVKNTANINDLDSNLDNSLSAF